MFSTWKNNNVETWPHTLHIDKVQINNNLNKKKKKISIFLQFGKNQTVLERIRKQAQLYSIDMDTNC